MSSRALRTVLAALGASLLASAAWAQDTIKIGVTQPLTGAFAASGNYVTQGAKIEAPMKHWLQTEWDYASWSESTMDSAIMGSVDECVAQLEPHIAAGVDRIIFVPYKYEKEQVEAIAKEVIPRLMKKMA